MSATTELTHQSPASRPPTEPLTPLHAAARRGWDDRLGHLARQARNWRLATFALAAIALVAVAGLAVNASRPAPKPLYVTVDRLTGQPTVQGFAAGETHYTPGAAEIRYFLQQWIEHVRGVSLDPVVVRQNWLHAYAFMTPAAAEQMSAWLQSPASPLHKIGAETVSVQVNSVLPIAADSYEARWTETTFDKAGAMTGTVKWAATFTIAISPPTSTRVAMVNPLGLYIRNFAWHRDLAGGSTP